MILFSFKDILFSIYALIVFVLVLGVIICIHEGGHFFFAKKAGILCHEYSIGMGPLIKQWKKPGKETAISVRAIPIGGYVSMAGEDTMETMLKEGQEIKLNLDDEGLVSDIIVDLNVEGQVTGKVVSYDLYSKNGEELYIDLEVNDEVKHFVVKREAHYILGPKEKIQIAPYDRCFESKKWWPRFITIFAGPMMNFILAFVIFIIVGLMMGVTNTESSKIGELAEYYPASRVLKVGDEITKIGDLNISSWDDVTNAMIKYNGSEKIIMSVKRDGALVENIEVPTIVISYRLGVTNFDNKDIEGDQNYLYQHDDRGLKVGLVYTDDYVVGKAGLKSGDIITGYYDGNGTFVETKNWKTLINFFDNTELEKVRIKYIHNDKEEELLTSVWTVNSLDSLNVGSVSKTSIGITCSNHFSFFGGLKNACVLFWDSLTTVFKTLGALFFNKQVHITDLSGPVGIFAAIKNYLSTDFVTFMSFVGLISANIGLVNLLPIPALDGGRILFLCIEGVTRKKINKKVETVLNNIVFFLLLGLFVFITIKDIIRLF